MEIHQFLESFSDADAIGYHVLEIQRLLKTLGLKSKIFAKNIDPKVNSLASNFTNFVDERHSPNTKIIFHHSIYSDTYNFIRTLPFKKILIFHNITPPEFFDYKPDFQKLLSGGYTQATQFNKFFQFAIADSNFNRDVLTKSGFRKQIIVIPPFLDINSKFRFRKPINNTQNKYYKIIFVSKIAPHKRQDELILSFRTYQRFFGLNSRLFIIGNYEPSDLYCQKVLKLAATEKGVKLTGKINLKSLAHHYQTADLFLSLSEHEGFAVPIVEAMHFSLPIIAYNAGAVADTLGSGGILLNQKNPLVVASAIDALKNNKKLQASLVENQTHELERFSHKVIVSKLRKCLLEN